MSDDIVIRLRVSTVDDSAESIYELMTRAADEIERLRVTGDALAATGGQHGFDEALEGWKELRNG
jgi:hypothetical protein